MTHRTQKVTWQLSADARTPWQATVGAEHWQVRVNEFPEVKYLYALHIDGAMVEEFQGWPNCWTRPPASQMRAVDLFVLRELQQQSFETALKTPSRTTNEDVPAIPASVVNLLAMLDAARWQATPPTPFEEITAMRRLLRERARAGIVAQTLVDDLLQYATALEVAYKRAVEMQLGAECYDNTESAGRWNDLREHHHTAARNIVRAVESLVAKPAKTSGIPPVESRTKRVSVDQLFNALERKNAKDLAKTEREAAESGKEPFVLSRLEELLHEASGTLADEAQSLRSRYYIRHPAIRTLAEFAKHIRDVQAWD